MPRSAVNQVGVNVKLLERGPGLAEGPVPVKELSVVEPQRAKSISRLPLLSIPAFPVPLQRIACTPVETKRAKRAKRVDVGQHATKLLRSIDVEAFVPVTFQAFQRSKERDEGRGGSWSDPVQRKGDRLSCPDGEGVPDRVCAIVRSWRKGKVEGKRMESDLASRVIARRLGRAERMEIRCSRSSQTAASSKLAWVM